MSDDCGLLTSAWLLCVSAAGPVLGDPHTHLHHATYRSCFIGAPSVDSDPQTFKDVSPSFTHSHS